MKRKMKSHIVLWLIVILLLSACGKNDKPVPVGEPISATATTEPVPVLVFTFRNGTCDLEGPSSINSGPIKMKIVIEEGNEEAMQGVAVVTATLDESKTIADLEAWPSTDKPPWANIISLNEHFPGSLEKEFSVRISSGPAYFVCFLPDAKIGAHGPLEVIQDESMEQETATTSVPRTAPTVSPNPLPVVIDTDMGLDDWMAILYLLNRTDVEVKAITVTGAGETHCAPGVKNVLKLIELAGKSQIPVACGRETPLSGSKSFPKDWRDFADSLAGQTLIEAENPAKDQDVKALLQSVLQNSNQKVTLLTLGPLTNIADLLRETPQAAESIEKIYIMGGAVEVFGNVGLVINENVSAEWNIYVDPVAASEVLASGVAVTLVPLDATNQVPLDAEFYTRLENDHPQAESTFIYEVLAGNLGMIQSGTYYFWDPLAAAILADPSLGTLKELTICVDTAEGASNGTTRVQAGCPAVQVVMGADRVKFENSFIETLNAPN